VGVQFSPAAYEKQARVDRDFGGSTVLY